MYKHEDEWACIPCIDILEKLNLKRSFNSVVPKGILKGWAKESGKSDQESEEECCCLKLNKLSALMKTWKVSYS